MAPVKRIQSSLPIRNHFEKFLVYTKQFQDIMIVERIKNQASEIVSQPYCFTCVTNFDMVSCICGGFQRLILSYPPQGNPLARLQTIYLFEWK